MTSKGKLSKRDMATLNGAWEILNDLIEQLDEEYGDFEYESDKGTAYYIALRAEIALGEFIDSYETRGM